MMTCILIVTFFLIGYQGKQISVSIAKYRRAVRQHEYSKWQLDFTIMWADLGVAIARQSPEHPYP